MSVRYSDLNIWYDYCIFCITTYWGFNMAFWDGKRIVYFDPEPSEIWPDWDMIDCGCCSGIEWGGEVPRECKRCGGDGHIFRHRKSGVTAQHPGGPFC